MPEQVGVSGTAAPLSSGSWASRPTEASKRKEGPENRSYASLQKLSFPPLRHHHQGSLMLDMHFVAWHTNRS